MGQPHQGPLPGASGDGDLGCHGPELPALHSRPLLWLWLPPRGLSWRIRYVGSSRLPGPPALSPVFVLTVCSVLSKKGRTRNTDVKLLLFLKMLLRGHQPTLPVPPAHGFLPPPFTERLGCVPTLPCLLLAGPPSSTLHRRHADAVGYGAGSGCLQCCLGHWHSIKRPGPWLRQSATCLILGSSQTPKWAPPRLEKTNKTPQRDSSRLVPVGGPAEMTRALAVFVGSR